MDSLATTIWDVVISGTGVPQALLALSLSRSGLKILHLDRHSFYGGDDAAFTLQEAEEWVQRIKSGRDSRYSDAQVSRARSDGGSAPPLLRQSRSYALNILPQIIYTRSRILQALVSSQIHAQLEFLAVGSWWVHTDVGLRKIPSGREDVFADESLQMRDKRALMKFLRYALTEHEAEPADIAGSHERSLGGVLSSTFGINPTLQLPLLALTLSRVSSEATNFDLGLSRIKRHMQSVGTFGAGFGAVIPKYGGNAEIAQVACRAGAVGGGVYVLGQGVNSVEVRSETDYGGETQSHVTKLEVVLSGGEKVQAKYVVGSCDDLPQGAVKSQPQDPARSLHSISIITDPLTHLFPPTSENGPLSAVAIVLADEPNDFRTDGQSRSPIYLQVHSDETGECPRGQCVVYGSTICEDESSRSRLDFAVERLLRTSSSDNMPSVCWSASYVSKGRPLDVERTALFQKDGTGTILAFPPRSVDIAFDDSILDCVKAIWGVIMGQECDEEEFLKFEYRGQDEDRD